MVSGLLFAAASILLLIVVFETATRTLEEQMIGAVEMDAKNIERFMDVGAIDDILEMSGSQTGDDEFRRTVIDAKGQIIVDQIGLKLRPIGSVTIDADEMQKVLIGPNPFEGEGAIGFGIKLASGSYILVAQEDEQLTELREALLQTLAASVLAVMLFAIIGGTFVSFLVLRRLDRFNAVANDVAQGRIASRMPLSLRNDEFDRLAIQLNAMLTQLEASMEALKQVSSDIAHDLRTPLTRLKQRLEQIDSAKDEFTRQSLVTQSLRDADNMLEVFSSLLRISQIEAGAARSNFALVDLSALLQELAEIYEPVAADGGRRLSASIGPAVKVSGDRALLQQLFTNLIENALTHTPVGSSITLGLNGTAEKWQARVADDGPGIALADRERIFDRFYRLEKSRTTPGTGLGLSLVHAIALAHGFNIDVQDNSPGTVIIVEASG